MLVDLNDVRWALENDEVFPCFQPLVELRTGRLAGFEVLPRWNHPSLGLILPSNFIALAEQNRLIGPLTQQIMRKAFKSAPMLPEPLVLGVNVSAIQLREFNLLRLIRETAEETDYPLSRLMIEIAQSVLVENLERAQNIALELKSMGCRLALDGFGIGNPNLANLQILPFSELKVDEAFVQSMTTRRESRKIVAALVDLGHSLGMTTVAKGVESEEEADTLLWLGCELAQGGPPLPAGRIPDMVAEAPRTLPETHRDTMAAQRAEGIHPESLPAPRLAQLRAIYNGAPVGICFVDRGLRHVSLNQCYADWVGAPLSALRGKTMEEVLGRAYPLARPFLLRALQGETILDEEISLPPRIPAEPDVTVLASWQPVVDEARDVIGTAMTVVAMSEPGIAEEALCEREEHYRRLIELSPQTFWIRDADGNLMEVNSRWLQASGMSREQAMRLGWLEAVHPKDRAPALRALRQALQTARPINVDYRMMTSEGKWKLMRAHGAPGPGPSGTIMAWYGGSEYVDERNELERQFRRNRGHS